MLFHSYLSFVFAKCINLDLDSKVPLQPPWLFLLGRGLRLRLSLNHHTSRLVLAHPGSHVVKCQTFSLVPLNCCFIACTSFLSKICEFGRCCFLSCSNLSVSSPKGQPNKESNMIKTEYQHYL